jgi:hypothetical protein
MASYLIMHGMTQLIKMISTVINDEGFVSSHRVSFRYVSFRFVFVFVLFCFINFFLTSVNMLAYVTVPTKKISRPICEFDRFRYFVSF